MEFKEQITVKIGDEAATIIDGTMIIATVAETMTGGEEFRGLTNAAESGNGEATVPGNLPPAFPRPRLAFFPWDADLN